MDQVAVPQPRLRRAHGTTVGVVIGGEPGVLTVGHNRDGVPYWMQLRVGAHGSTASGLTDALATAMIVGLQHDVPPAALTDALRRIDLAQPGDDHADPLAETFTSVGRSGLVEMADQ